MKTSGVCVFVFVCVLDKKYQNVVEEQPIGKRLFVQFCSRNERLKNLTDFERELVRLDRLAFEIATL